MALEARRELFDLAQALPLTVFRYQQPATGAARFASSARGVAELFGVDAGSSSATRAAVAPGRRRATHPPTRAAGVPVGAATTRWVLRPQHAAARARRQHHLQRLLARHLRCGARPRRASPRCSNMRRTATCSSTAQRGITHCNPAACALFGADDAHALLGRMPVVPAACRRELQADGRPSRERALELMRAATRAAGERVQSFEWRFRRFDGTPFDADVSVIALEWEGRAASSAR